MRKYFIGQFQIFLQCFLFIHCEISNLDPLIISCQDCKENNSHNNTNGIPYILLLPAVNELVCSM